MGPVAVMTSRYWNKDLADLHIEDIGPALTPRIDVDAKFN